jgi:DNA-binding GntR family transcriptional regulator
VALLADINRQMFDADEVDWEKYLSLNREFHFHIYAAAGMPRLLRLIESLWLQIGPLLNLVASREEMRFGREAHEAMVRGVAHGDPSASKAAIERDIQEAAHSVVDGLRRGNFAVS